MFGRKWTEQGYASILAAPGAEAESQPPPHVLRDMGDIHPKPPGATTPPAAAILDPGPRRLVIGRNLSLRGEIGACDDLRVEGFVAASAVDCRAITVTGTGTFEGRAEFETAEIEGAFDGELTVRDRLTVRRTGRVSGRIRYGRIEVERGGQVTGDVCAIEPASTGGGPAK